MNDLLEKLGARLKQLRTERRLTQEQLAEAAGLSYKFLGEVERGVGNPTVTTLGALADALVIDIADFFIHAPTFRGPLSAHEVSMAREALQSIEAFIQRASPGKPSRYRARRRRS